MESAVYCPSRAEDFGRADARAHAAKRVRFEDVHGGAAQVAGADALDEAGDIDTGGAGRDARGVRGISHGRGPFGMNNDQYGAKRPGFNAHGASTATWRAPPVSSAPPGGSKIGTGHDRIRG